MAIGQEQIGALIKRAREDAGMTQAELADAIGLTNGAQSISRYERAETEVPVKRLRRIADATGKPMSFFIQEPDAETHEPDWVAPIRLELEAATKQMLAAAERLEAELERLQRERRRRAS